MKRRTLLPLLAPLLSLLAPPALAQIPLPNPPWTPPAASKGFAGLYVDVSVQDAARAWSDLLGDALWFYDAQRSGVLGPQNRVSWRNDSALQDGQDHNVDLTRGYFDAGDYLLFAFPLSYTLATICWGAIEHADGYAAANQTAYLDSMLRWGLDWMMRAHPQPQTLFVQVGDVNLDNNYWGGDQNIPMPRPSYQINSTNPGTDAAAAFAGAMSACSALYNGTVLATDSHGAVSSPLAELTNTSYAGLLRQHAVDAWTLAVNATGGMVTYQTSVPSVADAYSSSSYQDDLIWGATWLALATGESTYFDQAASWYSQWKICTDMAKSAPTLDWDFKTPALPVLLSQLSFPPHSFSSSSASRTNFQSDAEAYFDAIVNNKVNGMFYTNGGLAYWNQGSGDNSLNPALNLAAVMERYAPWATSVDKSNSYRTFARKQLDYALGSNPMHRPYIVGIHPSSPYNPHHAAASGGNDITNINRDPPDEAHVLYGALIGGPDEQDRYFDIRNDWPETEVALDYNAPLLTLVASRLRAFAPTNTTSSPTLTYDAPYYYTMDPTLLLVPSGTPTDAAYPASHGGLSTGAKVAIGVVVSVVGLAVICGLLWAFRRPLAARWSRRGNRY